MNTVSQFRIEFGIRLAQLLDARDLGLREFARAAGISHGLSCDIKSGRKCAGPEIAAKMADALSLVGEQRDTFLLAAAGTRMHDKLTNLSRGAAPEVVNHLPHVLVAAGVQPANIDSCVRDGNELTLVLNDGNTVTCTTTLLHRKGGVVATS